MVNNYIPPDYSKSISKLKEILPGILKDTHSLAEISQKPESDFIVILESSYRRAHHMLQAISRLSEHPHLSSPVYVLTRSLIEDVVAIEYIIEFGKEAMSNQFRDFYWIQSKEDNEFIREFGLDNDPDIKTTVDEVEKRFKAVKKTFQRADGSLNRNWAGIDVDRMLSKLMKAKPKLLPLDQIKAVSRGYLYANRKTHFNPIDLKRYMNEQSLRADYDQTMVEALSLAISSMVRLTTRYIDEISELAGKNMHIKIGEKLKTHFAKMESALKET